jgi:putative PIN family toxin of toxin-antitoxin system
VIAKRLTLLVSEPLLDELAEILSRSRFAARYGVTAAARAELLAVLRDYGVMTPVSGTIQVCRDPNDDVVIETALRGRAALLVTRDQDVYTSPAVLDLLQRHDVAVVGLRTLLATLAEGHPEQM